MMTDDDEDLFIITEDVEPPVQEKPIPKSIPKEVPIRTSKQAT